jgi:hypothetical protein
MRLFYLPSHRQTLLLSYDRCRREYCAAELPCEEPKHVPMTCSDLFPANELRCCFAYRHYDSTDQMDFLLRPMI